MNPSNCPPQIRPDHRARLAIAYVRQSTERQVLENQGSTADQRAQADIARAMGWPLERIRVFEDLGLSGASTAHRPKFIEMQDLVRADEVGAIFVSDPSRLGRNTLEQIGFLDACRLHDVVIIAGGVAYDLTDSGQMLTQHLLSSVAEFDNLRRRDMLMRGRQAKLAQGKAVTRPPAGYVRTGDGAWNLDPDALAQMSIRAVFTEFLAERSLSRTMKALHANAIRIPRRDKYGNLRWVKPVIDNIATILKHPAYTGTYVFGVRRNEAKLGRTRLGTQRSRRTEPHERTTIENHHPAYVTQAEWDEVKRTLAVNAPAKARRNLGPGTSLAQGLVRCRSHDRALATYYHSREQKLRSFHGYICPGDFHTGGKECRRIAGYHLDRALREEVLLRLLPPTLASLRDEWRQAKSTAQRGSRMLEMEVEQARRQAVDAKQRALAIDPELALVSRSLFENWEDAERRLRELERRNHPTPTALDAFTEAAWSEILQLAERVESIWNASTTEMRDRKEIVRLLVEAVWIEERTPEFIRATIVWTDGSPNATVEILLPKYAHSVVVQRTREGATVEQITQELNTRGILNTQGNRWTVETIRQLVRQQAKQQGHRESVRAG